MNKRHIFTNMERELLKELVISKRDIVENKKIDSSTVQQKNKAWDKIGEEFNASINSNVRRTVKQLRKLWDNMKTEKKKQMAAIDSDTMTLDQTVYCDEVEDAHWPSPLQTVEVIPEPQSDNLIDEIIVPVSEPIAVPTGTPRLLYHSKQRMSGTQRRGNKRVRRMKCLIDYDQELHSLLLEEQKEKIKLAKLNVLSKQEEMKRAAEMHEEELKFKKKMWEIELKLLEDDKS